MGYSYTEKKRIRKDFGKRPQVMEKTISVVDSNRFIQTIN